MSFENLIILLNFIFSMELGNGSYCNISHSDSDVKFYWYLICIHCMKEAIVFNGSSNSRGKVCFMAWLFCICLHSPHLVAASATRLPVLVTHQNSPLISSGTLDMNRSDLAFSFLICGSFYSSGLRNALPNEYSCKVILPFPGLATSGWILPATQRLTVLRMTAKIC